MGPRTISRQETTIEERAWPLQGSDPRLIAALTATLVEYRNTASQSHGAQSPDDARSNWRVVTRVTQLR